MTSVSTSTRHKFDDGFTSCHVENRAAATVGSRGYEGSVIGTLTDFSAAGRPRVCVSAGSLQPPTEARSCVRVGPEHLGRSVVLLFEDRCPTKPIIVGLIEQAEADRESAAESAQTNAFDPVTIDLDGHRVVLSATHEIVLRCGDASITLTKAGKILLRGTYVSSHSAGVNRVKGASVEIN